MSIKTFIFSQPDKPIVKEKKEIDQTYKKFRFEIIASVFISYAVFYLTRKNFSAAMPAMLTQTSLTAEDFAIMFGEAIIFARIGDATSSSSNQQWRGLRGIWGFCTARRKMT